MGKKKNSFMKFLKIDEDAFLIKIEFREKLAQSLKDFSQRNSIDFAV
ncbi:MAG: hypothetical protein QXG01_02850 [Candidatus Bathyarchaeia archaeon]